MTTTDLVLLSAQSLVADLLADVCVNLERVKCSILAKCLHLLGCLNANPRSARAALISLLRARIAWINQLGDIGLPLLVRWEGEVYTVWCETYSQRLAVATTLNGRGVSCLIPFEPPAVRELQALEDEDAVFGLFQGE
jgi:hypothetical protein